MPTVTKQQKVPTKDVKLKKVPSDADRKKAEIKKIAKQAQKDLSEKEANLRKLASEALRKGSSEGGKMLAALRKK